MIVGGALLGVGALPAAFVSTIALLPVWRGVEGRWGIEAVGHSGPAGWCYVLTYAFWVMAGVIAWRIMRR